MIGLLMALGAALILFGFGLWAVRPIMIEALERDDNRALAGSVCLFSSYFFLCLAVVWLIVDWA